MDEIHGMPAEVANCKGKTKDPAWYRNFLKVVSCFI